MREFFFKDTVQRVHGQKYLKKRKSLEEKKEKVDKQSSLFLIPYQRKQIKLISINRKHILFYQFTIITTQLQHLKKFFKCSIKSEKDNLKVWMK